MVFFKLDFESNMKCYFRDIEYHLLTWGGDNQWPSHVTVNGKLTFKNKAPALKFNQDPETEFNTKEITNEKVSFTKFDMTQRNFDCFSVKRCR